MVTIKSSRSLTWQTYALIAYILCIHVTWWFVSEFSIEQRQITGGDGYIRFLRILQLVNTGDWYDITIPGLNSPYGGTIHWTRLLDILILALAVPFMPFFEIREALYVATVINGPLQHVVLALLTVWVAQPLIGRNAACLAGALTVAQVFIFNYSAAGRLDHHILFVILALITMGYLVRTLQDISSPTDTNRALLTGLSIALGLWVGPEALFLLAICLLTTGLPWLMGNRNIVVHNCFMMLGLVASLLLILLVERGAQGLSEIQYDRISIVHLVLAILVLIFWAGVNVTNDYLNSKTILTRLAVASVGALITIAVLLLLYPRVYLGPMADVDPYIRDNIKNIAEFVSIKDIPHFLYYIGGILFALPWLIYLVYKHRQDVQIWAWVFLAITMLIYLPLSVDTTRLSVYTGVFISIVLADLVTHADRYINLRFQGLTRTFVLTLTLVILTIGPYGIGSHFVSVYAEGKEPTNNDAKLCSVYQLAKFFNNSPWADTPQTILASPNLGAEILYRTDNRILGTMHHPVAAGIIDSTTIFESLDDAAALPVIQARKIDMILICTDERSKEYNHLLEIEDSLYNRLLSGRPPHWINEVDLPEKVRPFRLFLIDRIN